MDEQLLKDLIATAEASNYNWEEVMPKFPELADVDLQVLKDYVETAKHYDYDYNVVNAKFPELGLKKKRRVRTYCSRGRYGIHYTSRGGTAYLIGVFRSSRG
tara:strand:+ start:482 stop:787 length:306 start_codon:yes stop_codon:yes gene_type:complete